MQMALWEFLKVKPPCAPAQGILSLSQDGGTRRSNNPPELLSRVVYRELGGAIDIFFSCFDNNLNRAARKDGFLTHQAF